MGPRVDAATIAAIASIGALVAALAAVVLLMRGPVESDAPPPVATPAAPTPIAAWEPWEPLPARTGIDGLYDCFGIAMEPVTERGLARVDIELAHAGHVERYCLNPSAPDGRSRASRAIDVLIAGSAWSCRATMDENPGVADSTPYTRVHVLCRTETASARFVRVCPRYADDQTHGVGSGTYGELDDVSAHQVNVSITCERE